MTHTYRPHGVCSRRITFAIEDGVLKDVAFEGGCSGNTQGLSRLAEGMRAEEALARLEGVRCGFKSTSCPDQLAKAIRQALEEEGQQGE